MQKMKNGKNVEKLVYSALIRSIVGLAIIAGLLFLISVLNTRTNLGIPQQIFGTICVAIILLSIIIVLQGGVLIHKIQAKEKICPKCNNRLPKWRIPPSCFSIGNFVEFITHYDVFRFTLLAGHFRIEQGVFSKAKVDSQNFGNFSSGFVCGESF